MGWRIHKKRILDDWECHVMSTYKNGSPWPFGMNASFGQLPRKPLWYVLVWFLPILHYETPWNHVCMIQSHPAYSCNAGQEREGHYHGQCRSCYGTVVSVMPGAFTNHAWFHTDWAEPHSLKFAKMSQISWDVLIQKCCKNSLQATTTRWKVKKHSKNWEKLGWITFIILAPKWCGSCKQALAKKLTWKGSST